MVLSRAMSRRTSRTRAVFSSWPVARWKRRLNCSFLSLSTSSSIWSALIALTSEAFISRLLQTCALGMSASASRLLVGDALNEARLDRQLGCRQRQRLARELDRHAVDLKHDAAGLDPADPVFRRALTLAHAHLDRLL